MEGVLAQVVERLSNPEVLFGLAIRLLGVFIILVIVMLAIYLLGYVFMKLEKPQEQTASHDVPEGPSARPAPPADVGTSPASRVPDEAAARLPLAPVPDDAAVAIALALSMIPDDAAVAIALALNEAVEARSYPPHPVSRQQVPSAAWEEPGSAWKLLGRHEALFRKTSLTRNIHPRGE